MLPFTFKQKLRAGNDPNGYPYSISGKDLDTLFNACNLESSIEGDRLYEFKVEPETNGRKKIRIDSNSFIKVNQLVKFNDCEENTVFSFYAYKGRQNISSKTINHEGCGDTVAPSAP